MNFTILHFDALDSTNTEALKQARRGADEGLAVVARQQTAGRGRQGRTWISEKDAGLYFSVVLRPQLATNDLPLITLAAGVAVHDALSEFGLRPDIKWVNDVLINEKKIAGILAETAESARGLAVVVGIGINLMPANFPPAIAAIATALASETGRSIARGEVLNVLTRYLGYFYELLLEDNGPAIIVNEWRLRSSYSSGKTVRVVLANETITGTTEGLEQNGALRVRTADGVLKIIQTGDVENLRIAG